MVQVTWSANVTLIKFYVQWLFHLPRTSTPNKCCHQLIETARYKSTAVASQIPHMLPIEHIWGVFGGRVHSRPKRFNNLQQLSDRVKGYQEKLSVAYHASMLMGHGPNTDPFVMPLKICLFLVEFGYSQVYVKVPDFCSSVLMSRCCQYFWQRNIVSIIVTIDILFNCFEFSDVLIKSHRSWRRILIFHPKAPNHWRCTAPLDGMSPCMVFPCAGLSPRLPKSCLLGNRVKNMCTHWDSKIQPIKTSLI